MFHIQPLLPKTLSVLSKHSAGIYFFKAISGNTRTMCEIISKLTKKTLERLNGIFSGITNFIHFSGVCLLLLERIQCVGQKLPLATLFGK